MRPASHRPPAPFAGAAPLTGALATLQRLPSLPTIPPQLCNTPPAVCRPACLRARPPPLPLSPGVAPASLLSPPALSSLLESSPDNRFFPETLSLRLADTSPGLPFHTSGSDSRTGWARIAPPSIPACSDILSPARRLIYTLPLSLPPAPVGPPRPAHTPACSISACLSESSPRLPLSLSLRASWRMSRSPTARNNVSAAPAGFGSIFWPPLADRPHPLQSSDSAVSSISQPV